MNLKHPIEDLFAHLHNIEPLSENFTTLLPACMMPVEGPLAENTIVLEQGEISDLAYWMPTGYARAYVELPGEFPDEVRQETINYWKGGELVTVKDSFFKQQPSTHFLEIAKDSVLRSISYDGVQMMKMQTTETNELIGKILSDDYAEVFDRARLLKLPAKEKYAAFLDYFHPNIEQYFELRTVASYLDMDPTTLSILRR